jgi:hypothetical protein
MEKEREEDLIFTAIKNQFLLCGNLDPESINLRLLLERTTIDASALEKRIDEFKKSKTYKEHGPKDEAD